MVAIRPLRPVVAAADTADLLVADLLPVVAVDTVDRPVAVDTVDRPAAADTAALLPVDTAVLLPAAMALLLRKGSAPQAAASLLPADR